MKENPKYNIAVIGLGYWGSIIVKSLIEIKCKKIYVYDKNNKNTKIIKSRYPEVIVAKNLHHILKDHNIKNIFLSTPPNENLELCKLAIKSNKNIFIEKPAFDNLKSFYVIEKLLINYKQIFMIGYIYLYNIYIHKIKKIIDKNTLGKIKYINLIRKNFGPIRTKISSEVDLSTHDISILNYLFNKKIIRKSSIKYKILNSKNSDITNTHLKIGNINIDISSSWLNPEKVRKIIIIGSKQMLLFDEMNYKAPIQIFYKYAKYPELKFFKKKFFVKKIKIFIGKSKKIKLKDKPALINELNYFFRCIKKKKKPITSIEFGKKVLSTFK